MSASSSILTRIIEMDSGKLALSLKKWSIYMRSPFAEDSRYEVRVIADAKLDK